MYLCPETLNKGWIEFVKDLKNKISLFVIDEFHGMTDYANFRPDYTLLGALRTYRPEVPFMLLSATVTPKMKQDAITSLGLRDPRVFEDTIDRPLLFWNFRDSPARLDAATLDAIDSVVTQDTGTVMIFSKTVAEAVANWEQLRVRSATISAELFHSHHTAPKKESVIQRAIAGTCRVICCTSALGAVSDSSAENEANIQPNEEKKQTIGSRPTS